MQDIKGLLCGMAVLTTTTLVRAQSGPDCAAASNPEPDTQACAQSLGLCEAVPAWIANGSRGDIVLVPAGKGVIGILLSSLGQSFSHSGMLLDETSIRHNTLYEKNVSTEGSSGLFGAVPERVRGAGDMSLRDGYPGVLTQPIGDAFAGTFKANGILITGSPDDAERRAARVAAADTLEQMEGWYRLFSYTDMAWDDPFTRTSDAGSMCSGTIAWAHKLSAGVDWPLTTYSEEVRNGAAQVLHDAMANTVAEAARRKRNERNTGRDVASIFTFGISDVVISLGTEDSIDALADHAANQTVNCMAFNDCENGGTRWQGGVGAGASMSPDDLRKLRGRDDFPYDAETTIDFQPAYVTCSGHVGTLPDPLPTF